MTKFFSLLMTFILMILSLFGGNTAPDNGGGDIDNPEPTPDVITEFNYSIHDKHFEFNNIQYGKDSVANTLDLYIPRTNSKCEMGLVLFIHSGGWLIGNKSEFSDKAKDYALNNGVACASINYSTLSDSVGIQDMLNDITNSLTAIKSAGEQVAVTIKKTVLVGYSAGGHLALTYAYSMSDTAAIKPAAVISYAGATDFTNGDYWLDTNTFNSKYKLEVPAEGNGLLPVQYILSKIAGNSVELSRDVEANSEALLKYSPVNYYKDAVPTLLIHGKNDTVIPYSESEKLDSLLDNIDIDHTLISLDNSDHNLNSPADADNIKKAENEFNNIIASYIKDVKDLMPKEETTVEQTTVENVK